MKNERINWPLVVVVDIGSPGKNIGWSARGLTNQKGSSVDALIELLARTLPIASVALGFEAPMFLPARDEYPRLTTARSGEGSHAFSSGPSATVLVTGLVVIRYLLSNLRKRIPQASATFDWTKQPIGPGNLLLFEAFVTGQPKEREEPHIADADLAAASFASLLERKGHLETAIEETECLNLLGAILLHTGWSTDIDILHQPCLVIKPEPSEVVSVGSRVSS